jgi:hypothetical protein
MKEFTNFGNITAATVIMKTFKPLPGRVAAQTGRGKFF